MFEFFSNVWGAICTAMDFLWTIINSLLTAVGIIAQSAVLVATMPAYLPIVIGSSVTIVFGLAVAKFMVGR